MISWASIIVLLIILVVVLWWVPHARAREGVTAAVKQACVKHNYQFLDQAASLEKVRLLRDGGFLRVNWFFYFDYFDGDLRCRGRAVWSCGRLQSIEFVGSNLQQTQNKNPNVIDLDRFRKE